MLNSISNTYRSLALQFTVWLIFAGVAGTLTFMVWVASAVKPTPKTNLNSDVTTVLDPNILLVNHNPDEMHKLVQPITFDAIVRDKRNYPKEFKDSRFIKANLNKWTVQVMNVVQHEVITDYLAGREDREKFNYFRIIDENNQKRFVLTYGIYNSPQEAIGASKVIGFNLPNDVKTFPEEFKLYSSQMDEYEITPPLQDVGKNAPKSINLSPTRKEIPAKTAQPKPETEKPKESIESSNNANDTLKMEEKRVPVTNPIYAETEKTTKPKENPLTTNPQNNNPSENLPKNTTEPEQKLPQPVPVKPADNPPPKRETRQPQENNNSNANANNDQDLPVPIPVE